MDLPSKNLFEIFKDEIRKDLGPLDPDWFEVLTSQTSTNDENIFNQDDLCLNQEGHFKPTSDSLLFSTPKVFRDCQVVSPEIEGEQSFADGHEKEKLPWMTTQSPNLLKISKDGNQCPTYGGILGASQNLPSSYVKRISESLGAEIHPDISWTSSLNTPPPSTLILSPPDESPCPASLSAERNVVLVRKLFPSLSNPSRVVVASRKNNDLTTVHKGVFCGDNDNPKASNTSQSGKQNIPDAIEDRELRSTVASVLEGAEDVLSFFFTNPSSTLRKVKTDRVRRKQMARETKDDEISAYLRTSDPTVSSEQKSSHQETEGHSPPPPLNSGNVGITQWSPLSLSEIALFTGNAYDHKIPAKEEGNGSRVAEELQQDFDCGQRGRPQVSTRHTGLTKKKRRFIYTVETPKCRTLADTQSQKVESFAVIQQDVHLKALANAPAQVSRCCVMENDTKCQTDLTVERIHPFVKAKLEDLDISQLSKYFAQDFSQIPELTGTKDTSQNIFSPSTCLSMLKQANKERQTDISHECDVSISSVITSNQNIPVNESTISDSGFQSAVGNGTHITVCETDLHETDSKKETGNNQLGSKHNPVIRNEQCTSAKGPVNWTSPGEKDQGSKKKMCPSIVASGFNTTSNKARRVLSANLQRDKHIFEETGSDPNNKGIHDSKDELGLSHESDKKTICNSYQTLSLSGKNVEKGQHLTASQKADMTELCTLLEEADSQFEFTQFQTTETKLPCQENTTSPKKPDNEKLDLDADLLTGIDFDESFSLDAEKHLAQDKKSEVSFKISNMTCGSTSISSDAIKVGKFSPQDAPRISQDKSSAVTTEPHVLGGKNNLMLGVGFKTANGNVLKVSKQCLSKAKDLFADLEPHFLSGISQSKQSSGMDAKMYPYVSTDSHDRLLNFNEELCNSITLNGQVIGDRDGTENGNMHANKCHNGFQLANGKVISVSENALQGATAFFSHCDTIDNNSSTSMRHKEGIQPASGKDNHKSNFQKCKNVQGFKEKCPKRELPAFEKRKVRLTTSHTNLENGNCRASSSPTKAVSSPFTCTNLKHIDFSLSVTNPGTGFSKASGDKVLVSAEPLKKAQYPLRNTSTGKDTNRLVASQKLVPPLERCGFQTASGKGVSISHAALTKAKSLLQDCGEDEVKIIEKHSNHLKMPIADPPARSSGFCTASGKAAPCSSEALQKAKALFNDISSDEQTGQANHDDQQQDNTENKKNIHCGFLTAGGAKVHISQKSILKAKNLLREFDSVQATENQEPDYSLTTCSIVDHHGDLSVKQRETLSALSGCDKELSHSDVFTNAPPTGCGFHTARGKKVSVSDIAMMKAKSLLDVSITLEGIKEHQKPQIGTFLSKNGGFQTASGKECNISSAALQKAKTLFSEIEPVVDKSNLFKKPFLADSEKKMSFSSETPGEANAVSLSVEFADTKNGELEDVFKNKEIINCGFTTAGGAKVHVSQNSLLKAKSLLNDIPDGQTLFSNSCSTSQHNTGNLSELRTLPTASHKNIPHEVKSSNSLLVNKYKGENTPSGVSPPPVGSAEKINLERMELSNVAKADESSFLCFQSFDINDCSETQQRFLAQEALDCTKALLEDESLLLEDNPQSTADDRKRKGKRVVDDPNMAEQPPLKRCLLEEFDRTDDGSRGSVLNPEKCSPNGIMSDRRVFKGNVSFQPNITTPHRSGTNYMETSLPNTTPTKLSALRGNNEAHPQKSTFIPQFTKNVKLETPNSTTSSAFAPPFRQLRNSSKTEEEEHKHHFIAPFTNHCAVPSTKQCTFSVAGNNPTEDVPLVTLAETTIDERVRSHGSDDPAAETVCKEDTLSRDLFQHNVELACDMQDMRIRKKKRQTMVPLPGSLFLKKSSGLNRIPLKAAVYGKTPAHYTPKQLYGLGVPQNVSELTSETAESFRFSLTQYIKLESLIDKGGIQLADGGWLIPRNDGTAGKEEFYRALCDTMGVDPKLISEEWVYNHYRWIVWKQASMERSFPEQLGSLCLTPEQVLRQLKYRYDLEVDQSRRPALRKIMEKDDTAAKTLILCVCGVVSRGRSPQKQSFGDVATPGADPKVENPFAVIWLTDGWYSIKAQLDGPLTSMLHRGRLLVGGKLIVNGAQLVGSQDACSPLEAPESIMLKICANSSRPARWDSKLGFYRDPRPFLLPVSSLCNSGGPVGCVDIIILRSYPTLWMERKPEGGTVFRSGRAEEKEARRYNTHKEKAMEILFEKIQAEFEKEERGNRKPQHRRRTFNGQDIKSLQDGEELYEAVGDDPAYLEVHLTEQQAETLQNYKRLLMEKKQAELQDRYRRAVETAEDGAGSCPKRDVAPVWRLCIADSMEQPGSVYQLNLWRPPSELQSLLKEGCRYKVYNLTTSDSKKQGGNTTVQLTGTKKTQFDDLQASEEWLSTYFQPRVSANFFDLQDPEFHPLCGEVDLTGYVISIIDGQGFSPAFYLTDGKQNFVKVRCFSSFAQSGLEHVIKPRVLLALSNLQLRGLSASPTPVLYAGDLTIFSTNPKEVHLQESFSQLKTLVQVQENFFVHAQEKLSELMKSDCLSAISSPAGQAQTLYSTVERRGDTKANVTYQQPGRSLRFSTAENRTPAANSDGNPSTIKKRKALDYLSRIPSPPPLSFLSSASSPSVKKTFIPPRKSETSGMIKSVKTPTQKPSNALVDDQWVNDEELAMIDTQALHVG